MKYLFTLVFAVLISFPQLNAQDNFGIRPVGSILDYWASAYSVAINGQTAFVATGSTGLYTLNINDPFIEGQLEGVFPERVIIEGDRAYLLGKTAFTITDLNANPNIIGSLDFEGAHEMDVSGDLAVVSCSRIGLILVDVSEPELQCTPFAGQKTSFINVI